MAKEQETKIVCSYKSQKFMRCFLDCFNQNYAWKKRENKIRKLKLKKVYDVISSCSSSRALVGSVLHCLSCFLWRRRSWRGIIITLAILTSFRVLGCLVGLGLAPLGAAVPWAPATPATASASLSSHAFATPTFLCSAITSVTLLLA
uniref:Uncharacterized protein n=1 Tax=Lygus hesperus TaxID=30085 RepID=A0A146LBK2_LYGHE